MDHQGIGEDLYGGPNSREATGGYKVQTAGQAGDRLEHAVVDTTPQHQTMLCMHMTDPTPDAARQPIFNIPPATKALLIINVLVHLLRLLLPNDLDDVVVATFAFIPARYSEAGAFGWPAVVDPITYQVLHGSLTHLGINMLALLAFGGGVERRIGGPRMLGFTLICGVVAALAHFMIYPSSVMPIIGASGAISGLFGAVLRFHVYSGSRRGLWPLVVLWVIMDVVTGTMGMGGNGEPIAWVAHIGGFIAGLLLFGLFDHEPGRTLRDDGPH